MRHAVAISAALLGAVVLGACNSATAPTTLPLAIQATAHSTQGAVLAYQIENSGVTEQYLRSCEQEILVAVQREEDGNWVNISIDACHEINELALIAIAPAETRQGIRAFDGVPGRYRVVAWGHRSLDSGTGTLVTSNVVVVN